MEKYSYCWWENKKIITLWLWKWETSYSITCSNKFKCGLVLTLILKQTRPSSTSPNISNLWSAFTNSSNWWASLTSFKRKEIVLFTLYINSRCIGDRNGPVIVMLTFLIHSCKPLIPNNRKTNHNFSDLNLRPSGMCQCWSQMIFKVSLDFKMFFVKWIL